MATHSSIPAWRIPWREEPGRLKSMGSWRVRHGWATITFFSDIYDQTHGWRWRKRLCSSSVPSPSSSPLLLPSTYISLFSSGLTAFLTNLLCNIEDLACSLLSHYKLYWQLHQDLEEISEMIERKGNKALNLMRTLTIETYMKIQIKDLSVTSP